MITPDEIKTMLVQNFPDAQIEVEDLTGTYDHFQATVVWPGFQGKGLIEQHQLVNRALHAALEDGRIHALKIKTMAAKNKV